MTSIENPEMNPPIENSESQENQAQKIIDSYIEFVLLNGQEPPSIFAFCKQIGMEESTFYNHFNDFNQVADAFWTSIFKDVLATTESEADYAAYSVREQFLALYYNFFEELKKHRSYALINFKDAMLALTREGRNLSQLKKEYKNWASRTISQAISNNEIANRSRLTDIYDTLFWYQFLFLINFWRKDGSKGFQKTDAAIEKAVNLSFDLIEKNALDSAFDFGKFMFQNR